MNFYVDDATAVDEVIEEIFKLFKNNYQNKLELIKRSEFVFDYVHLFYYKWSFI